MKLAILYISLAVFLLCGESFAHSSNIDLDNSRIIIMDGGEYIAKSSDSDLVFFPVHQAVRIIKSAIGISDNQNSKDTAQALDNKKVSQTVEKPELIGSGSTSGAVIQALSKGEYLVIQRAIRNHKKALDVIANVLKNNKNKKSIQVIETLYKQTSQTLYQLENELKIPTISKIEIKKTISLIQKQIKQIQSELKKLDK